VNRADDRAGCEHVFAMEPDLHFLAGFVAGEGHFRISENNAGQSWSCGFALRQRDDNAELVAEADAKWPAIRNRLAAR
jgi:hypothetical protein